MPDRCPNPNCDGTGWITVGATGSSNAYRTPGCVVGPHQAEPETTPTTPEGDSPPIPAVPSPPVVPSIASQDVVAGDDNGNGAGAQACAGRVRQPMWLCSPGTDGCRDVYDRVSANLAGVKEKVTGPWVLAADTVPLSRCLAVEAELHEAVRERDRNEWERAARVEAQAERDRLAGALRGCVDAITMNTSDGWRDKAWGPALEAARAELERLDEKGETPTFGSDEIHPSGRLAVRLIAAELDRLQREQRTRGDGCRPSPEPPSIPVSPSSKEKD